MQSCSGTGTGFCSPFGSYQPTEKLRPKPVLLYALVTVIFILLIFLLGKIFLWINQDSNP